MNRRIAGLALAVTVLVAACGDDGPTAGAPAASTTDAATTTSAPSTSSVAPTPTSTSTTSTTVVPATAAPTPTSTSTPTSTPTSTTVAATDPLALAPPLLNSGGANEAASGVAQLIGFGGTCTAFLVDLGPLDQPATALTNGHCVGIFDATTVLEDVPVTDAQLRFRLFPDTLDAVVGVPVTEIAYASMRATDVAVLRLGATRQELDGLTAYALGAPPAPGDQVGVVGVPASGVAADQWFVRGGNTCTAGDEVRVNEWEWLWDAAIASDCAGIVGGSSGSPMFAAGDPTTAVGIVNTTTIGAGPGGSCYLGQPCEIGPAGVTEVPDRTYAMPLGAWAACWSPVFDVAAADCPAEQPPVVTVDAPLWSVQPGGTWAATIANGGPDRDVLVKTGPASTTDCRDPAGYGDPAPANPERTYDQPLPTVDDVYVLCAARSDVDGAPSTADAGYAVMQVDARPPDAPITLSSVGDGTGRRVEPVFAPPEYSSFFVLYGPAGTVDCAATDSYSPYRRVAIVLDASQLPATLCVIGVDEAGNRGAPQEFALP